ncbi:hypothetical protein K2173_021230 [Erythroxylum novogranatense]|uniref:Protein root UVB sensitive 1, chloroplastic n=1 Tax=Erythroxylum novogranatense TaxID=1862640 RepID=A0AAV8TPW0_9ROSI|nr:hypothetical protein K2173_021230 [Erythroxylum novogranatense]
MAFACRPLFLWGTWINAPTSYGKPITGMRFSPVLYPASLSPSFASASFFQFNSYPSSANSVASCFHLQNQGKRSPFDVLLEDNGGGGDDNNNNNHNNGNNGGWWWWWNGSNDFVEPPNAFLLCFSFLCCSVVLQLASSALARTDSSVVSTSPERMGEEAIVSVWEVSGSKWTKLIPDILRDEFIVASSSGSPNSSTFSLYIGNLWLQCRVLIMRLLLPDGFPHSVTADYLDYSLWRGVQGIASQISGVLATQSLLYAVGLGKGAIPTAAAINWVLKDGIGYLSKIMLSKYGRHFDVNPKGWRLFADLLENAAFGLEMLTPAFPHLFVFIGAAAGAGRSAAALIQAATRNCFCAGFAAQRNFAEVIAKGEAQGMVSKFLGIMMGIALANCIGTSIPLALASFSVVTSVHMFCNMRSYQSIQLRTLNPYRASLVFSEYLLSGQVPPIKHVNDEEPLFPALPFLNMKPLKEKQQVALCSEARNAAVKIEKRLQLGSKLSDIVKDKNEALALVNLYRDEAYILNEHEGNFCVVLKESSTPQDMLKSLFQVNYLYWLERNAGIEARSAADDCRPGGRLHISLEYMQREFNHVKSDSELTGWIADGLIARPLPNRIGQVKVTPYIAS